MKMEKEMTTHSSIRAWKIPWIEEPGGLHSPWGRKESDTTAWATTWRKVRAAGVRFSGNMGPVSDDVQPDDDKDPWLPLTATLGPGTWKPPFTSL